MRILVAGRSGQLARSLIAAAPDRVIAHGRDTLDLSIPGAADEIVRAAKPEAIVNAAAYTNVDGAETDEATALRLNADAAGELAEAAAALRIPFVHVSTDYVFDGEKSGPYVETDPVAPINAYGRTKLAGERAVMAAHPGAVVLRTSWVYDHAGKNFPLTILARAKTQPKLAVVDDQVGCPTYAPDLAALILQLVERLGDPNAPRGIFHAAGNAATSWHGFARAVLGVAGLDDFPVDPVPSSAYVTAAIRPRNSQLASDRLKQAFGFSLPGWPDAVPRFMAAVRTERPQ